VLKHCYCQHEYKKIESKKVHQKGSKSKKIKIVLVKAGIKLRIVHSLQLRELDVQHGCNSTFHYSLLHQCIQQQTKAHTD